MILDLVRIKPEDMNTLDKMEKKIEDLTESNFGQVSPSSTSDSKVSSNRTNNRLDLMLQTERFVDRLL
jgi:hypothetical protein